MGSLAAKKPHAVCVPYPSQGHINPMLMLAKLIHCRGFHITFVLTEYNYNRLVRSQGPEAVKGLADFCFETIPDGLPASEADATQDVPALCDSTTKNFLAPFRRLIARLNDYSPPVSCIVSDGVMTFALDAAREFGIPGILFWTASACGFLSYIHYQQLIDRGLIPLANAEKLRTKARGRTCIGFGLEVESSSAHGVCESETERPEEGRPVPVLREPGTEEERRLRPPGSVRMGERRKEGCSLGLLGTERTKRDRSWVRPATPGVTNGTATSGWGFGS